MLEHLEPVILQTLRVCRPYVAALTLEQGLQKCSEVVQAAQKPGMGGVWLPLLCACLVLLSALMWATQLALSVKHTWDNRKGGIAELTREPSSPRSRQEPQEPRKPQKPEDCRIDAAHHDHDGGDGMGEALGWQPRSPQAAVRHVVVIGERRHAY